MTSRHRAAPLVTGLVLLLAVGCTTTVHGSGTRGAPGTATVGHGLVPYTGDGFTVSMPGKPSKTTRKASTAAGPIEFTFLTVVKDRNTFGVAYADLPAGAPFDLDGAARGAANNALGELADVKKLTYRGADAIDFRIDNVAGRGTGFQRVLHAHGRLYEVIAIVLGTGVKSPPAEYPLMRDSLLF